MKKSIKSAFALVLFGLSFGFNYSLAYNDTNQSFFEMSQSDLEQLNKTLDNFVKSAEKFCKSQQPGFLQDVKKMQGCPNDVMLPAIDSGRYIFYTQGIVNGKCHIQKKRYEVTSQHTRVNSTSDCYVPLADYNKAYSLLLQFANNMCTNADSNIYNKNKASTIILDYCR